MNVGDLFWGMRAESKQLELDAKKGGEKAGTTAAKSFSERFKGAAKGVGPSLVAGFGLGAGLGVFGLVTGALGSVVAMAGEAQQAASDLGEQQSKLDAVFTESAAEIREWSEGTATSLGLSQRAALEATGTLGNFLQAMGTAEPVAAGMSMELVGLAADLASFNNIAGGAEEVLIAIQSGLAGETEPLRRYGVDISDAAVQTRLLADGVQKVAGAFTQAQKIQARYAIIIDKTSKAQGDYARTASSSANQERTLAALRENMLAKIGIYVDNIVKFGQALAIDFVKALEGVVDMLEQVNDVLFPDTKTAREARDAIIDMAKAHGVDEKALLALYDAQKKQISAEGKLAEGQEMLLEGQRLLHEAKETGKTDYTDEQLGLMVSAALYESMAGGIDTTTEAVEENAEAVSTATGLLDLWNTLTKQEQKDLTALGHATDESTEGVKTWGDALREKAVAALKILGKQAAETRQKTLDLAESADIAKGSFKDFWKSVREQEEQVRFFIRHPDKLRDELDKIEQAIKRAEAKKARLMEVEGEKRNVAAIKLQDDLIRDLKAKADEWRAIGLVYGNQAERGVEQAFAPTLKKVLPRFSDPIPRASGGPASAGLAYTVGEHGTETFLPQVDGRIASHAERVGTMAGGMGSPTVNLKVYGLPMHADTPWEVMQQARRFARLGVLTPRRQDWSY